MKNIPDSLTPYKKTPEFTETTIPAGLLKDHQTKESVWGKIVVLEGSLEYTMMEPELDVVQLSVGVHGVVEPTILHHIAPIGKVRFYVEFYR